MATHYLILKSTLVEIADAIRQVKGISRDIPVSELANEILEIKGVIVLPKLNAPVIRLETISDDTPTDEATTTAILGKAILGLAILGNNAQLQKLAAPTIWLSDEQTQKLATPVIYIETGSQVQKLATPIIRIETEQPIQKLNAPVIYLEIEEADEPIPDEPKPLEKLATPIIRIETEQIEEIEKLDAPYIYLEVEEQVEKLATPTIYVEVEEIEQIQKLDTPVIYIEAELPAPMIFLDDGILIITDTSGLAKSYNIYANDNLIDTGWGTIRYMKYFELPETGTYTFTVTALADGYKESAKSNSIVYEYVAPTPDIPDPPSVGYTVTVHVHESDWNWQPAYVNGVEIPAGTSYTFENVTSLEFTNPNWDTYYNVKMDATTMNSVNDCDYEGEEFSIEIGHDCDIAVITNVL